MSQMTNIFLRASHADNAIVPAHGVHPTLALTGSCRAHCAVRNACIRVFERALAGIRTGVCACGESPPRRRPATPRFISRSLLSLRSFAIYSLRQRAQRQWSRRLDHIVIHKGRPMSAPLSSFKKQNTDVTRESRVCSCLCGLQVLPLCSAYCALASHTCYKGCCHRGAHVRVCAAMPCKPLLRASPRDAYRVKQRRQTHTPGASPAITAAPASHCSPKRAWPRHVTVTLTLPTCPVRCGHVATRRHVQPPAFCRTSNNDHQITIVIGPPHHGCSPLRARGLHTHHRALPRRLRLPERGAGRHRKLCMETPQRQLSPDHNVIHMTRASAPDEGDWHKH